MTNPDIWQVLLPIPLKDGFDYRIPADLNPAPGRFVRVPFGKTEKVGVVWRAGAGDVDPNKIKSAVGTLDLPALRPDMMAYADWLAAYTMNPRGAVLKMIMAEKTTFIKPRRARKKIPGIAAIPDHWPGENITLDDYQSRADEYLRGKIAAERFSVTLLEGVTGSGKTAVYFQSIAACLKKGRQALILLPEISLSDQLLRRFADHFGAPAVLWHSDLPANERRRNWLAVADGGARVVIGARSALFLPFADLGLIVVDEEHEAAFKQEEGVLYHGRDMAVARAHISGIPVILASATPSLETIANVQSGKYGHVHLPSRFGGAQMPNMQMVDMRIHPPPRGRWLSPPLVTALEKNLQSRGQSLLFLNRRGYAPLTLCRKCGHRLFCKQCSAALVEHQQTGRLNCHHCGYSITKPKSCPNCHSTEDLRAIGPGVERIAEEVRNLFPNARVAVMSSDLTDSPQKIAELVQSLELGQTDIIIGTQMIAKGYHFPALTLAGVVDADLGLMGADLRAAERTYQLLLQVAGRSGRGQNSGHVVLQSYQTEHPVLQSIMAGDQERFYALLMEDRKIWQLPPFGRLAAVILSAADSAAAERYAAQLSRLIPHNINEFEILGPSPAPMAKLRGKHRIRFLVKSGRHHAIQDMIRHWLSLVPQPKNVRVQVDIDPYSFV